MIQSPIERQNVVINRCVYLVRGSWRELELRLEVRTRVDVRRDQHEIQVISVRSAGVPFKVIQSPDASCYSGSAQQNWWRIRVNLLVRE